MRRARWQAAADRVRRGWPVLALGLMVFGALYQSICHTEAYADDAAITFAYSRQLAETGELVHTASSERVEGFSNPTWTFLCAIPFLLQMDPYMFARAVGLLSLIGTILLVYLGARRLFPRSGGAQLVAPLLQAMAPCVGFWTVAGLETPLVGLLLAGAIVQVLREELDGAPHRSGLILAALALTRPEGILFAAPVALYKLLRHVARSRAGGSSPSLGRHLGNLAMLAVPVLAYLLWRRLYFAAWLPNTYHAKLGSLELLHPDAGQRPRGFLYVTGFLRIYHLWPAVFASPAALLIPRRRPEAVFVVTLVAAHIGFVLWVNGDWMGDFRLFAMAMPAWALLVGLVLRGAACAGGRLASRLVKRARQAGEVPRRLLEAALALAFIVLCLLPTLREYARSGWVSMELVRRQGTGLEMIARGAGLLRATVAVPDVGGSALWANVHVLDTVGLTDRVVARAKGRPGRIRQYFFEEARPDFFQQHGHWKRYYNLTKHFEFRRDYVRLTEGQTKRRILLGDNYIRREHLEGFPWEVERQLEVDLGHGLRLLAHDPPIRSRGSTVVRLLVEVASVPPAGPERRIDVEARGQDGEVRHSPVIHLCVLSDDLLEAGTRLRVRAFFGPEAVAAIRIVGAGGHGSGWIPARSERAGQRSGASLRRFILQPRTHFVCRPPPRRWSPGLRGRGRLQRFDACRPAYRRGEVSRLVDALVTRSAGYLAADLPVPAVRLLRGAELLRPTAASLTRLRRTAARTAYRRARAEARAGRQDRARALAVAALRADPLLARARSLYLDLVDGGLGYDPDSRERAEVARDRLRRRPSAGALREALAALLQAHRAHEAARLLEEVAPALRSDPETSVVAAQAQLGAGLCRDALESLPGGHGSCEAEWTRHRSALACGESSQAPQCPEPTAVGASPGVVFDMEDRRFEGWELSGPLQSDQRMPRQYVSGYSGRGLLRTDEAAGGPAGSFRALSPELELRHDGLSLQVGGGRVEDGVSVALLVDGQQVRRGAGQSDAHLRRLTWDVTPWQGRRARLLVEDRGGEGGWGFLLVDHVRAHPLHYFDVQREP